MPLSMFRSLRRPYRAVPASARPKRATMALAPALAATLLLAGCGGIPDNQSLNSIHQPVVNHQSYTLDVSTGAGGLAPGEQKRLADWFAAMDLRYGDRVAVDDPVASDATRAAVEVVVSHYGLLLSHDAPVTPGYVNPGAARIVLTRAIATVPHCPDWSSNSEFNPKNATYSNYGCAVNSNLAAMVANPDDLLHGARDSGLSAVASNDKAINAYHAAAPTGTGGLKNEATK